MKKLQLFGLILAALVALPLVLGLVRDASSNAESLRASGQVLERRTVTPRGNYDLGQAKAFKGFQLYTVGDSFRGLPLNAVMRINARPFPGEQVRADHVTFMYGSCESVGGQGCAVPLQAQVWNACERNRDSYAEGPGEPAITATESLTVRGVQAAYFEDFSRLELYSGVGTIVIFSDVPNRDLLLDAAKQLRGFNVQAPVSLPLPALGRGSKPLGCGVS